jgi:hypothetical protein
MSCPLQEHLQLRELCRRLLELLLCPQDPRQVLRVDGSELARGVEEDIADGVDGRKLLALADDEELEEAFVGGPDGGEIGEDRGHEAFEAFGRVDERWFGCAERKDEELWKKDRRQDRLESDPIRGSGPQARDTYSLDEHQILSILLLLKDRRMDGLKTERDVTSKPVSLTEDRRKNDLPPASLLPTRSDSSRSADRPFPPKSSSSAEARPGPKLSS